MTVKVELIHAEPKQVEAKCPNCKRTIHVLPGLTRCGYCNATIRVTVTK